MNSIAKTCFKASRSSITSSEFLDTAPRGAYTTARTVKGTNHVFQLKRHLDRLVNSSTPFLKDTKVSERDLKKMCLLTMDQALENYKDLLLEHDCKLTVVVAPVEDKEKQECDMNIEILAHVEKLKSKGLGKPVFVAMGGKPRENARIKDSKWVHDRKAIVDQIAEDTLLLGKDDTVILEGAQTNFFAVLPNGILQTAGEGVLEGTVRAIVLEACRDLKIPVSFEPPKVSEIEQFSEAFLASTSRLVLPIDILGARNMPPDRLITDKIQSWVKKHVEDHSTSVKSLMDEVF